MDDECVTDVAVTMFYCNVFFSNCLILQNYFKDSWNVFDFITVVGSIIDVLVTEIKVSTFIFIRCFQVILTLTL